MTTTSYDLTAYPGKAYSFCDPDRLAVIGHLHGLLVSAPDAAVVVGQIWGLLTGNAAANVLDGSGGADM